MKNIYVLPQEPLTVYRCYVCVFLNNLIMWLHGGWFGRGLGDDITGSCSFMLEHILKERERDSEKMSRHQRTLTVGWP